MKTLCFTEAGRVALSHVVVSGSSSSVRDMDVVSQSGCGLCLQSVSVLSSAAKCAVFVSGCEGLNEPAGEVVPLRRSLFVPVGSHVLLKTRSCYQ